MTGIFASLFDRMGSASKPEPDLDITRAFSSDSTISDASVDINSNAQSSSSTPPTSIGDTISISSTSFQLEQTHITPAEEPSGRSRRQRTSVGTYNVKVLSGTAIHAPRKYLKGKNGLEDLSRRKTISGEELTTLPKPVPSTITRRRAHSLNSRDISALELEWPTGGVSQKKNGKASPRRGQNLANTKRKATDKLTASITIHSQKSGVLGKRRRLDAEDKYQGLGKAKRELRNLADTNEFAKIDTQPIIHEVWSNGKLVVLGANSAKAKTTRLSKAAQSPQVKLVEDISSKKTNRKKEKIWLSMGLYAGQEPVENLNWFKSWGGPKDQEKDLPPFKPDGLLPLPMWHGQRLLHTGRDFKLPFDVCAPLPPGQPKPDEWHRTSSNRFVGEAGALWKKSSLFDSFSSKCVCTPEGGCDEDCQNRIMLYECDDTNCASGRDRCTNRAFAQLQERRKGGGKFRIGVEVIKTSDRGYGVRSNRCFEPNQIIVEYTGEIITEDECDRRMNEDYKNNNCYYLMSFDQNMIIDATKGSIARFVNHSCRPNCRMVKWIVGGKPRMALFAGDKPIMSGDELTYDYNFDPFSAKNVQECLCGSDNCRGVLGPRPKDQKLPKENLKDAVKATVKAGKRKFKQILGVEDDDKRQPRLKKRKMVQVRGKKRASATVPTSKKTVSTIKKKVVKTGSAVRSTATASTVKGSRKPAGLKKYSVVSKRTQKVLSTERTSPRSKARRSYREYLEKNRQEKTFIAKVAVKPIRKRLQSFEKEESNTIRVLTNADI